MCNILQCFYLFIYLFESTSMWGLILEGFLFIFSSLCLKTPPCKVLFLHSSLSITRQTYIKKNGNLLNRHLKNKK